MQPRSLSTEPAYFVINSQRKYQPSPIDDRSLLEIFNTQKTNSERIRLPVSARCHRVAIDDKYRDNKENAIKQGQVLNVYYKHHYDNQPQTKQLKSHSTIKKPSSVLGFDIDRNLRSIDKSIFLYQRYNNEANSTLKKDNNPHGPFQQILFKSSHESVSSQLNSSSGLIRQKKSRLKAYRQRLKDNLSQQESAVVEIVDHKTSRFNHIYGNQDGYDHHAPHWLINKRQVSNQQKENNQSQNKQRSIIQGVMVLDAQYLQTGGQIKNNNRQHQRQQTSLLPKNKIITHLLTQSQRQLPLQKPHHKVTNLHPKPCQSLILQPQSPLASNNTYHNDQQKQNTQTYLSTEEFYQQQMKRRQQADYILTKLTSLEIIK